MHRETIIFCSITKRNLKLEEGKWREQELMPFCKISKASKFYIHASLSAPGLIWFQKLSMIELD